ncbi:hypothetical protein [Deinococcus sonorensis]|uniref:Uncharacterized protein n=2 Tax=Deinococcus sonorensis TaxID=309891 RepID=A0AAU7U5P6_9DEIO
MSLTIVMTEGKTLYLQDATPAQLQELRLNLSEGHGAFEFTLEGRSYLINTRNVLYVEVTPATSGA